MTGAGATVQKVPKSGYRLLHHPQEEVGERESRLGPTARIKSTGHQEVPVKHWVEQ